MQQSLFDPKIIDIYAKRRSLTAPDFLPKYIADQMLDRLNLTCRTFKKALIISPFIKGSPLNDLLVKKFQLSNKIENLEILPFSSGQKIYEILNNKQNSYELVISFFSWQLLDQRELFLSHILKILKEDGLFFACQLGEDSLKELKEVLSKAELELSKGGSPKVAPFPNLRELGDDLQKKSFALTVCEAEILSIYYSSFEKLIADLRSYGAQNSMFMRAKKFAPKRLFSLAAQIYNKSYKNEENELILSLNIIYCSGWKPSQTQQKAAKPNSAQISLQKALEQIEKSKKS